MNCKLHKAPKCKSGKCKSKKAPQKAKKANKNGY